jgi:hypothetical protein
MKIIALDESRPQSYGLYTALDNLFYFLAERLPKFFLINVKHNNDILQIPKYITKMHYDSLDEQTRDLLNELAGDIYVQKI